MNRGTPILLTPRLALRQFDRRDLDEVATMVADDEQMRFYPRPKTRTEAAVWLARTVDLYAERGFGVWRVEDRATAAFAGYCGFRPLELGGTRETEMVWHVHRPFWRRGVATEAAAAARDAAFERFAIRRLVAIVHPENAGSRRVAENIGMIVEGATTFEGEPAVIYGTGTA